MDIYNLEGYQGTLKKRKIIFSCKQSGKSGCVSVSDMVVGRQPSLIAETEMSRQNSMWKREVAHGPTPLFGMLGVGLRTQPSTRKRCKPGAIQGMHP